MKHFNLLNNFRWFATIFLLLTLNIGQVLGGTYTYQLVIRKGQLKDGGKYLLLVNDRSKAYSCSVSSGHLQTSGTFSSSYTTAWSAVTTTAEPSTINYVTLINKSGDTYYILDSGGKYITATAAKSGSFSRVDSDTYGWTFSGSSGLNAQYQETNKKAYCRSYNNSSFRSYANTSSGAVFYLAAGYSVTYNANGATSGDVPTDAYLYGSGGTVTVKSNSGTLAKTGFTFAGWNTKANGTGADKAASATFSITQDTVLYAKWVAVPSCSVDPSVGNASLNGSFNLSTVGVQCASITPGTNCSVASGDYGFIWYERDGTKKEIGGSGVTKVAVTSGAYSSGSFSANLTKSSFELGTRYSVRAFATNGKPATAYSDTITFQPRSVTFNLNGHGSSTPTTQYVNNGDLATDPSYSESVTGYTFGGWYKEAGCSNAWTFGSDAVSGENKTLYAKWTANEYTITLNQDLTPTSAGTTSITATYNSNSNLADAIDTPTKDGWTFAGYYTAKNGGGTQIIDADGNIIAGVATYTDASKKWIKASGVTLYAKWTCTVTWSVNGLTNVYSTQTLTYNGTSTKVGSVPGPPDPASYCGNVFAGWSQKSAGSESKTTSYYDDLFTNVAGSPELKTVGNVTFYAVFADYDE